MTEYIKREDAIDLFWSVDPENDGSDGCTVVLKCGHYNSNEIEAMLSNLPTASVVEVRHGRWKLKMVGAFGDLKQYSCSECGFSLPLNPTKIPPYCEDCGAKMSLQEAQDD